MLQPVYHVSVHYHIMSEGVSVCHCITIQTALLQQSKLTIPHYYLSLDVNMAEVIL